MTWAILVAEDSKHDKIYIPDFAVFCFPANQEYYHQWNVEECHGCSLDLSTFTIEELDNITSEYTLKNPVRAQIHTHKPNIHTHMFIQYFSLNSLVPLSFSLFFPISIMSASSFSPSLFLSVCKGCSTCTLPQFTVSTKTSCLLKRPVLSQRVGFVHVRPRVLLLPHVCFYTFIQIHTHLCIRLCLPLLSLCLSFFLHKNCFQIFVSCDFYEL